MGCHFFLQCMKVESESEIAQSCLTLSDPMDCSLPGSSIHGIFRATVLELGAIAFSIPRQRLETTWKPRPAQDDEVAIVGASRRRGSHRHAPSGVNRSRHGPAAWGPGGGALGAALLPSGDAQQGCPGAGAGGSAGPAASWKRWAPRSPQRGGIPKAWEDSHSAGAGAGVEAAAILGEWTVQAGQVALRQKDAPPSPGGPSSAWETSLSLVS